MVFKVGSYLFVLFFCVTSSALKAGLLLEIQMGPCASDYASHCSLVIPGEGRVVQCLQENFYKLSESCREWGKFESEVGKEQNKINDAPVGVQKPREVNCFGSGWVINPECRNSADGSTQKSENAVLRYQHVY